MAGYGMRVSHGLKRQLAGAAALFAMAGSAGAEEITINGAVLDLPAGWTKQSGDASAHMFTRAFPRDADGGLKFAAMLQVIGPSRESPDSLEQNFKSLPKLLPALPEDDPLTSAKGVTINNHKIMMEKRCCDRINGVMTQLYTVGVASQARQVHLLFVMMGDSDDDEKVAEKEFEDIVRTMRLEPADKPFVIAPRSGDGGLDGVFTRLESGLRINPFGGMDYYSESYVTQFDKSGIYSDEIPPDGQTIAEYCVKTPDECGLYAMKGGGWFAGPRQIEMLDFDRYGIAEVDLYDYEAGDDGMNINGKVYSRIPPFESGKRFDGVWRYTFAQVGNQAYYSGSVVVERVLRLKKDGTFERSGFTGVTSQTPDVGVTTSSETPATTGTYSVNGYTLQLKPDGTAPESFSIYAPDVASDGLLIINGSNYLKQD